MKLNHINLCVADVAGAVRFFETHFAFTCTDIKGEHMIAVLQGADDFVLVLMSAAMNRDGQMQYPAAFHIGFMQDHQEQVMALYQQLAAAGIHLPHEPRKIRDSFGFYFHYDHLMIEVGTR